MTPAKEFQILWSFCKVDFIMLVRSKLHDIVHQFNEGPETSSYASSRQYKRGEWFTVLEASQIQFSNETYPQY